MVLPDRPGSLSNHIVNFCRFLRTHGYLIGPAEEAEVLKVLADSPFSSLSQFKLLLQALLAKSHPQQTNFEILFNEFWQELFTSFDSKLKTSKEKQKPAPDPKKKLSELKSWLFQHDSDRQQDAPFYGGSSTAPGNLADHEWSQISALVSILKKFARDWAHQQSRRFIASKKNQHVVDLRKTMRKNIYRGEIIDLAFRRKKIQKLNLVVLCDVSRSMELFSQFTVQFLYAFQNSYKSIDTFVFGTKLFRISHLLKQYDFETSLKRMDSVDWSGGTRIGQSLEQFIQGYGAQLLNKKTIVLIVSDGWDTGDLDLLEWSMAYIQRRANKVLWLNPQAGKPGFKPEVAGMKTALPFIDIFQGVHNLESLAAWQRSGYKSL